jgi:hypothetical protein
MGLAKVVRWYWQYLFSYKGLFVFRYNLQERKAKVRRNGDVTLCMLSQGLVDLLCEFHARNCKEWEFLFDREEIERRLVRGERCFLAMKNNEIVAFSWFAENAVRSPQLACSFFVRRNCMINYNGFVDKSMRGMNVSPSIKEEAFEYYRRMGFKWCYSYVSESNESNLKSIAKNEGQTCGRIVCGYFLGLHYVFLKSFVSDMDLSIQNERFTFWKNNRFAVD